MSDIPSFTKFEQAAFEVVCRLVGRTDIAELVTRELSVRRFLAVGPDRALAANTYLRAVDRVAEALCEAVWNKASENEREGYRQSARVGLHAMGIEPENPALAGDECGIVERET